MPPKKKKGAGRKSKPRDVVEDLKPDDLLELKTIYEGPGGKRSSRMLHKTTIIVTNRTVEIEREGANIYMTLLTLGCWYFCFQTASIEIYEVSCRCDRPNTFLIPLGACSSTASRHST